MSQFDYPDRYDYQQPRRRNTTYVPPLTPTTQQPRRRSPIPLPTTGGGATYLDQAPIYGDTSAPPPTPTMRVPRSSVAIPGPQGPQTPPLPDSQVYLRQQNMGLAPRGPSNPYAVADNAIQARTNAVRASAAPLPVAQPATGKVQFTEQQARTMLGSMMQNSPNVPLGQLQGEWAKTLQNYGIDQAGSSALWNRWQQEGTLGKAELPTGQVTTQPPMPRIDIPVNKQTGAGGTVTLPNGQQVVINASGARVGDPIAQGAPLPSTSSPVTGPERGYTPMQSGGGNVAQAPQPPLPTLPNRMGAQMQGPDGAPAPAAAPTPTAPVMPATPTVQPAMAMAPAPATPAAPATSAAPLPDPYAVANRTAYVSQQNDRADMLSGGFFTGRDMTQQALDAQTAATEADVGNTKALTAENLKLRDQNTRMANSQTLAANRTGATAQHDLETEKRAYYQSQINQAREGLRAATATFDPAQVDAARKALDDAHTDYRSYLGTKTGITGAPTTQPTAPAAPAGPGGATQAPRIADAAGYNALPNGATYYDPSGTLRRKQ